jgi:hypothetical protein
MVDNTRSKTIVTSGGRVAMLAIFVVAGLCAWNAGTSSLTTATMSMPLFMRRRLVQIVAVDSDPTSPLGLCEGDCDSDSDVSTVHWYSTVCCCFLSIFCIYLPILFGLTSQLHSFLLLAVLYIVLYCSVKPVSFVSYEAPMKLFRDVSSLPMAINS